MPISILKATRSTVIRSCLTYLTPVLKIWSQNSFVSINTSYACMLSCFNRVQLCATLWTIACQAPLSMGFPRQEYWSGLPFPKETEHKRKLRRKLEVSLSVGGSEETRCNSPLWVWLCLGIENYCGCLQTGSCPFYNSKKNIWRRLSSSVLP